MPASLTYPGVYIEELPSNVHTIAGVATSIATFIGSAPQGPTGKAVFVQSFTQYQSIFGGFTPGVYLAYAVNHFFANGGTQAYIIRLVWDGSLAPAPGTSPAISATAVAAGIGFPTAQITASVGAVTSPPQIVNVGAPVLQSLVLSPSSQPTIPLGAEVTLTASGLFADGSVGSLAGPVTWSSSNAAVSVSPAGVATANAVGSAVITAKSGLASASMTLKVGSASVSSIAVTPATFSLAAGQTQQLSVIASLTDGSTQDVTPLVSWKLPASPELTISSGGLAAPKSGASGSESVSASLATVGGAIASNSATANLGPAVAVSLAVFPAGAVANVGQTVDFVGRTTKSDGSIDSLSGEAWSSSNTSVATIDLTTGAATLVANGATVITVTMGALTASATLTVTPATLKAISVTPLSSTVASGQSVQLSATGLYSDGSSADLTRSVSWTPATAIPPPSPPASNTADPNTGLVTTGTVGPTDITATVPWQTAVTATVKVNVTAPVVASIAVDSTTPLLPGQSVAMKATATLSDGSTQSPVPGVKWSSSAPSIVSVNPTTGVATAVAGGGSLTLFANSPGAWGNSLLVSVLPQPSDPTRFGLLVQQKKPSGQISTLESFVNLSTTPTDPQFAVTVIDNDSNYVTFVDPATKPSGRAGLGALADDERDRADRRRRRRAAHSGERPEFRTRAPRTRAAGSICSTGSTSSTSCACRARPTSRRFRRCRSTAPTSGPC